MGGQRIVVCVDRSKYKEDDEKNEEKDNLYVYQLGNEWDQITKEYNEMHLSWKTKSALFPSWKHGVDGLLDDFIGGATDFGDTGFVFSFHVHSKDRVKCDQWIKAQKIPFLPYQLIDVY